MLLIVTERGDLTADFLILELEARGAEFLRFNTEDYPLAVEMCWRPEGTSLRFGGELLGFDQVDAVWYRRPHPPQLGDDLPPAQARWAVGESAEALQGVWRTLDALWVNHPDANRLAESKPGQLRAASALGFEIPPTVITNDPAVLGEFVDAQPATICKPLLDGLVPDEAGVEQLFFTSKLVPESLHVEDLGAEPYLFQGLIDKSYDIRVTVVGERCFAVAIESQGDELGVIDWRRAADRGLPHRVIDLPADLARRCVSLCHQYGLRFGAIDLAARPDGGYTFFEINPNGQWAWLEQETGVPLRAALADLLLQEYRLGK
jgi:glutathione synthase/RimK-type ligase-like ATP-grasp enzyme